MQFGRALSTQHIARASALADQARACTLCTRDLPHAPNPILQVDAAARILIAGQAPGRKAHESGVPFDDPSGDRLRDWMGIDRATFYDANQVAILPMAFCFPGRGTSGDLPPRRICAQTWRNDFMEALPNVRLTLVIGQYAQQWHLPDRESNLTRTVAAWESYGNCIPLPHPSPRNNIWLARNRWFEAELVPELRRRVDAQLTKAPSAPRT